MAKIFSNIATTTTKLKDRYADSTVSNQFTTFKELRDTLDNNPGDFSKIEIRRIEDVYDLYIRTPANLQPQTYNYSALLEPVVYTRGRSSKFYDGFPLVNPRLTTTNVPVSNTFVEIRPDQIQPNESRTYIIDRSLMLQDSQSLPLVSGPRDVERMGKYLLSGEGISFLAFQRIIQQGNTFGQTRSYDATSVGRMVLNYASANLNTPLERVSRISLGDATTDSNLAGRIQRESVITAQDKLRLRYVGGADRSAPSPSERGLTNLLDSYLRNRISSTSIRLPGIFTRTTNWLNDRLGTNFSLGNTTTLGQIGNRLSTLSAFNNTISIDTNNQTLTKDQTAYDQLYNRGLWPLMKQPYGGEGGAAVIRSFEGEKSAYIARARRAITADYKNINNANTNTQQYPEDDYRSSADYTDTVQNTVQKRTWAGITTATYLKDDFNLINNRGVLDAKQFDALPNNEKDTDYVKFVIKVPGVFNNGIYFRAFISDINHSTNGEYDSVRYVGRPERFITYRGMSRGLTLSMYLIAFSQDELDSIWTRANMLNKLMYPIDNSGGYMNPPLAKITIGNVLVDQPGYMENIDMRFTDIPWDIDKELPQAIQLNMRYNIIEDAYITQNNTTAAFAQLFNKIVYPSASPPANGPQPPSENPNTTAAAGDSQPAATPTVTGTQTQASRPAVVRANPAEAIMRATGEANPFSQLGTFRNLLGSQTTSLLSRLPAPWR